MHLSLSSVTSALLVGAASVSAGSHVAPHAKRHHDLAARESKPETFEFRLADATNATDAELQKRQNDARFTFYDVGLGACGITNTADQYIVALNSNQYGGGYPGPQCFKWITISYGGKTAQAQITDECPGCPYRGLDMSRGLFTHFASEDAGVIYGNWWFNDGDGGNGGGNDQTSTSTWSSSSTQWTPTTTWQPPSTSSSQWTPTTTWSSSSSSQTWTSSSSWSSSSGSSSSSSSSSSEWSSSISGSSSVEATPSLNVSSGLVSGLAVPTGSGLPSVPTDTEQNVYNINLAIIDMGALINAGAQLN